MKIKRLIKQLQQYDEDATVVVSVGQAKCKASTVRNAREAFYEHDEWGYMVAKNTKYIVIE